MSKKKIILIISTFFFIILLLNFNSFRNQLRNNLPGDLKIKIKTLFFGENYLNEIAYLKKSNYKLKILPSSEFVNFQFGSVLVDKLNVDKKNKYNFANGIKKIYIEQYLEKFIISSYDGNIFLIDQEDLFQNKAKFSKIDTNLGKFNINDVQDLFVFNDKLYISFANNVSNSCNYLNVAVAKINLKKNRFDFDIFFKSNDCTKPISAGRMIKINHNQKDGLLISTNYNNIDDIEIIKAQDDKSSFGKTLFIDFENKKPIVYTKGHKTPQGLVAYKDFIIATEHGPRAGDEINLLKPGKNYGWPIASYGENYSFKYDKNKYELKKNHKKNGFEEPIYAFVPAIGISQIVVVPENFHNMWSDNNFLVSSLNGRSIYRVKFDENFQKVIFAEKIFVGERIRDIIYNKKFNAFILGLEDSGSIGFFNTLK